MKYSTKKQLLLTTLMSSVALSMAATSVAQTVDDEVIVTGSLIPKSSSFSGSSPITQIDSVEFESRGVIQVEDMINTLPQAFGAQGSNLANGSTGTSSINLRGLGATRNLVLLNGKRMPYGSITTASVDVNFVPSALVKSVDILTGGASATYGSDAISGVANFIIDKEFEGARLDANYSFYQHNNNNSQFQSLLGEFAANNPDQYAVPNGSVTDGESVDLTGVLGSEFADGKGHMTAYVGYQKTKPILQADRDYSQCALSTRAGGDEFNCAGSSTNQFANLIDLDGAYSIPGNPNSIWTRVDPAGGAFLDRNFTSDTFNYNPYNHYQRPNERYNFGAFVDYELDANNTIYSELMFMENSTNAQIAPSGVFGLGVAGDNGGINCNNPFLSAAQQSYLCGAIADGVLDVYTDADGELTDAAGVLLPDGADPVPLFDGMPDQAALALTDVAPVLILRRNVEGGERNQDVTHSSFRGLVGLKGDFSSTSNLSYDVSGMFAKVRRTEVYNNDLSKSKVAKALNAVRDSSGNIVCAVNADLDTSNDDSLCVPYDIWSGNAPSQDALDYIVSPLNRNGSTEQLVLNATMFGDFGESVSSPYSDSPISFAAGLEYRKDKLNSRPDAGYQSGDGAGQGGPTNPIKGSQSVGDMFVELNVPLAEERAGIKMLSMDLAYRHSEYTNIGNGTKSKTSSDAYKIGGEYAPSSDLRIRGSYQRAVRAPNIFELFSTQSVGLFDLSPGSNGLYDPCASDATTAPAATAAACANTGVTAAQYGSIADNPAGQYNNFTGGNPGLQPEKSDTFTIGFVATPSFLEGLTFSVDYFDIKVKDFVGTVPEELALNECLSTGDAYYCGLINRGVGGTLWANPTGFITATNINTGELSTSGFDFLASYDLDLGFGGLGIDYVGTLLSDIVTKPLPNSDADQIFDCVGLYGGNCGAPNPEYRHKVDLNFMPNNERYSAKVTWRHYGAVNVSQTSSQVALSGGFAAINETLAAQNYIDLSGSFKATEWAKIRLGVNNIFDREPPVTSIAGTAPGNGGTYPQVYDSFGRYVFMGATLDF